MELSDLKNSLSTLSTDELMVLIKDIRSNRRTPKAPTNGTKPKAVAKKAASISLDALLASATPEQIEQLLAQLEDKV